MYTLYMCPFHLPLPCSKCRERQELQEKPSRRLGGTGHHRWRQWDLVTSWKNKWNAICGYMLKYSLARWLPFDLEVKPNSPKWVRNVRSWRVPRCSKCGCSYRILSSNPMNGKITITATQCIKKTGNFKVKYKNSECLEEITIRTIVASFHRSRCQAMAPRHLNRDSRVVNLEFAAVCRSWLRTLFFHDLFACLNVGTVLVSA